MGKTSGGCWNFTVDADGRWTWNHRDLQGRELARSEALFRYFHDCIEDAKRHGYRDDRGPGATEMRDFPP